MPLCAIGLIAFFVPYWLTGVAARQVTRQRDVIATAQVFTGAAIYAAWLAVLGTIAWRISGRTIAIVLVLLLPVLAMASLFAIERESAVLDAVRAWWHLRRARSSTRERLRRDRSELADVLDEVNTWLGSQTRTT
jgi:hypothetical protein